MEKTITYLGINKIEWMLNEGEVKEAVVEYLMRHHGMKKRASLSEVEVYEGGINETIIAVVTQKIVKKEEPQTDGDE